MSKPWRHDDEILPLDRGTARRARGLLGAEEWRRLKREWREEVHGRPLPHGSRTAMVLLALACLGAGIGLYAMAGPRDVFERDPGGDWSAVDQPPRR